MVRFIVVTGGVISGLGKGITSSSLGLLFKEYKYSVTMVKIDPYLNIDAGTMSPYEHGECYVLADGGEVDLDLGNYERFLDTSLCSNNNITTGKVYKSVIEKERKGEYLGKTVQIVPHLINEINRMILDCADGRDLCIIELGGTVGDIESAPFVEALKQLSDDHDVCYIHVSLLMASGKELKTKPTQNSVKALKGAGIVPNMLCLRSPFSIPNDIKNKLKKMCRVKPEYIIENLDVETIYKVPLLFDSQNVVPNICSILGIPVKHRPKNYLGKYRDITSTIIAKDNIKKVNIGIVGKYAESNDTYLSIISSIEHACASLSLAPIIEVISEKEITDDLDSLKKFNAVIVPGGFGTRGTDEKMKVLQFCRESKIPTLGICLGFQLMMIEYANNVCELNVTSEEFDDDRNHIIVAMKKYTDGEYGGTMRLGEIKCHIESDIYDNSTVMERFRHRYQFNEDYKEMLESKGLRFTGTDKKKRLIMSELKDQFYVGCQFHPEFISRLSNPHPLFVNLIKSTQL